MKSKTYKRVVFNLSLEHRELLKNQCQYLQVSVAFFVRNCVLEKLEQPIIEVKRKDLDIKNYTTQLLKIGNNLNQVAHNLNTDSKFLIADQKSVLKDIDDLKNHILEINSKL